jgi:hypothetical protein
MHHKIQTGQGLIEFALTVPIFLMLVFGIIDLARMLFGYAQVVDASRQAVRYGIVRGLEANTFQFLDCDGIRQAALDMPGLISLKSGNIDVFYEDAEGNKLADCSSTLTTQDISGGDVLVVHIHADIIPLTPVLMLFADTFPLDVTTRRTITETVAATDEWATPPKTPMNFSADVDCSLTSNNVSFYWYPMSPIPDRAEIREVVTGAVVAEIDDVEPGLITNAYCEHCATISTNDGYGMYYMVAIAGIYPSELASSPSNVDTVTCPGTPADPALLGRVFYDKDGDGIMESPSEKGIQDVRIFFFDAGPDGTLGTDDDITHSKLTSSSGAFWFYGLTINQNYRVNVAENSSPTRGLVVTTANDPVDVTLRDENADGILEFYSLGPDGIYGTADDTGFQTLLIGFDDAP